MAEFDRFACITIQGGGVYGLSLLGQLQAVHDLGFKPVALAGTSAGAIIAALYWAGLEPEVILERLLERAEQPGGLIGLVGPDDARPESRPQQPARFGVEQFRDLVDRAQGTGQRLGVHYDDARSGGLFVGLISVVMGVTKLLRRHLGDREALEGFWKQGGVFDGAGLTAFLEGLLRDSPAVRAFPEILDRAGDRPLTFADFQTIRARGYYQPPLFLAATNLTTRSLELINSVETARPGNVLKYADWSVVEAVRASAGFPGFFRPVVHEARDGEYSYVDGGIIANFPAFVFSESNQFREFLAENTIGYQAITNRPWVHVGLRLNASRRVRGAAGESRDPRAFLGAMKELLTSRARNELEERLLEGVPHSISIGIPFEETGGPDGVLDVEKLRPHTLRAMFANGYDRARAELVPYRFDLPPADLVEPELEQLVLRAERLFEKSLRSSLRFRANVFVPQGLELVLSYRARMDDPPGPVDPARRNVDREMRFEFRSGLTGFCFVRRRPLMCNLELFARLFGPGMPDEPRERFGFDAEIQDRVRKDRTWLASVPIFDPDASSGSRLQEDRPTQGLADGDLEGRYYVQLDSPLDGPLLGVLNLDSGWSYAEIGLPEDPSRQVEDHRILALFDILQSCAYRLGKHLSGAFACRSGP